MRELSPGLWHWQARHAAWEPSEPWDPNVSSYAIVEDERLLLFDPLGVPGEIEALAAGRETAIVLTCPWHERDAEHLVERLGAPVYTPLPDSAQYLMDTYGVTAEQAGDGAPDVVWLLREGKGDARPYSAGETLPFGADVFPGHKPNDTVLWIESQQRGDLGRHARRLRPGARDQRALAPPRRHARGDRRGAATAARPPGRARARDARRADRPGCSRARVGPLLARSSDRTLAHAAAPSLGADQCGAMLSPSAIASSRVNASPALTAAS